MYDKEQVKQAIQAVKSYNITTYKKIEHKYKLYEVKNFILDTCYEINNNLFNPEYNHWWSQYKQAVNEYRTKKELDNYLRMTIKDTLNQLNIILHQYCN